MTFTNAKLLICKKIIMKMPPKIMTGENAYFTFYINKLSKF